jgi:(E)-2-((N-methylformamido)methylene)succinate hydrolase
MPKNARSSSSSTKSSRRFYENSLRGRSQLGSTPVDNRPTVVTDRAPGVSANRPTVVFVHGVGLDASLWDQVRAELTDEPTFAYDLLGHGVHRDTAPASLEHFVQQLGAEIDRAGLGAVDLVGFSLGALIAQGFALAQPLRVRRLVLLNTVFRRTADERLAILDRVAAVRSGGYVASVDGAIDRWFAPEFAAAHRPAVDAIRSQMLTNNVASYANAYEIFATADADLDRFASQLMTPTLVVTGSEDPRSTPQMTCDLAASLQRGHARIIVGARHMTPVETPATVAWLINQFLGDCSVR